MKTKQIHKIVHRIAGPDMTDQHDCAAYLLDLGEPVLIDCGSGFAHNRVLANIRASGHNPEQIRHLILTHCHVDHIGGAHFF